MTEPTSGAPPGASPPPRSRGWISYALVGLGAAGAMYLATHGEQPATASSPQTTALPASPQEVPAGALRPSLGELIEWDQEQRPGETIYALGDLIFTMSSRATDSNPTPVLTLKGPNGETFQDTGAVGLSSAQAELAVGSIDPAAKGNQIIFNTFSGGAHCCQQIKLIENLQGAWRSVLVAEIDGDTIGSFPKDYNGDGSVEFKLIDNTFLYAFAPYASSWAPPILLSVRAGVVSDISKDARFRPIYSAYLAGPQRDCETNANNGACAAFVAAAARLGRADWAWSRMLAAYDKSSTWELPVACRTPETGTPCPDDQKVIFGSYPEALRWFLGDRGYLARVYLAPPEAIGPSYPCTGVTSAVLKLICGTPELSKADRQLAELYWRAVAVAEDPTKIQASERAFVRTRNNAPADAFTLLRLYQAQLENLSPAR